ncbi:MAG: Flp family type IVb pilin [Pseudomonadota bacterium]
MLRVMSVNRMTWRRFRRAVADYAACTRGATAIEYGLIVSALAVIAVVGANGIGQSMVTIWSSVSAAITSATP